MNLIKVIYPWHALSQEIIDLKQPTTQADHGLNALVRIIANMLCLREGRWGNINKEAVRVYGKLLRCGVQCSHLWKTQPTQWGSQTAQGRVEPHWYGVWSREEE